MEGCAVSKVATHLPGKMPKRFAELNQLLPLRPINDKIDLDNAYEVMDRLAVIEHPTPDQSDYLETLILLTRNFDKGDNEAAMARAAKVTGVELLKYIMQNVEMTQAELAKLLGVKPPAVSLILAGQRSITADHARVLGKRFKLEPGAFIK